MTDKSKYLAQIIAGMEATKYNVVLFKDVPEVWMQYWMGLFYEKPTIIVFQGEDEMWYSTQFTHPLVKKLVSVPEFSMKYQKELGIKIQAIVKELDNAQS